MLKIKTDTPRDFWRFWLLILLLVCLLIFQIYSYNYFRTECKVVKENPFVYAAKKANAGLCSCPMSKGSTLYFNQTNAWTHIIGEGPNPLDFTIINVKGGEKDGNV